MSPLHDLEQARAIAAGLVPWLAAQARAVEEARGLPDAHLARLAEAGLFRTLLPRRIGGAELDFAALPEVTRLLAQGCGSTAWVYANLLSHGWMLGMWPAAAQDEVWGAGGESADTLIGGSLVFPAGRAVATADGYRLSGRWSFTSGIDACAWVMLGAVVEQDGAPLGDAQGEYRMLLVPRGDFAILDTWYAAGLCGSGSKEVVVDGALVPAHRSLALAEAQGGPTPGSAINSGPLYRIPVLPTLGYVVAGVPLGVAQGALALFTGDGCGEKRQRLTSYSGRNLADFPSVQTKVAEAAASIDAAQLLLDRNTADIQRMAQSEAPPDELEKARLRRDAAFSGRLALRAVDLLFEASGGAALFVTHPAQRAFRDAHAAMAHIALNWDAASSIYGRVALGVAGELTPFER